MLGLHQSFTDLFLTMKIYTIQIQVHEHQNLQLNSINSPSMNSKPSILLVDDETAITDNLAPFLGRSGFNVEVASNGEEALQKVTAQRPDLLILDVLMPQLDGREVLRQLRQGGNWIPIILLTQVGEASERAMALEEGADDYLNKPFDPHELAARIRAVLRRARPGQPPSLRQPAWPVVGWSSTGFPVVSGWIRVNSL